MTILFRVDSFPEIGIGHIVRSIAIANELRILNDTIGVFFLGIYDTTSIQLLTNNNISYTNSQQLKKNEEETLQCEIEKKLPNIVFIDKLFNYSKKYILNLRNYSKIIMFHNLCEGAYYSHKFILPSAHNEDSIITDPNWNNNYVKFYWGSDFIPINKNVFTSKTKEKNKEEGKRNITISITTGGSDPKGVLITILKWLKDNTITNTTFIVLLGRAFIKKKELDSLTPFLPNNIKIENFNYRTLATSDIAISTFGVTTYELLYLGIPTISIGHAPNNAKGSAILYNKYNSIIDLGHIDNLEKGFFIKSINSLIKNISLRKKLKQRGEKLIDGGGLRRISKLILNN